MGHSTASMTERFRAERAFFDGFRRAFMMHSEQLLFDELWDTAEEYIPLAEKSSHPLLIATVLMSMLLEQKKSIQGLQSQLEKLRQEASSAQGLQKAEFARLNEEIQRLDGRFDSQLGMLRAEMSEMLYPPDGTL